LVVASAVDAVDEFSGAAEGGDGVGPEVVGSEEMVLGAGAGDGEVGIDITSSATGGEKGGPREVGGKRWCSEPELGRSDPEY
jgi:hypothetical protein